MIGKSLGTSEAATSVFDEWSLGKKIRWTRKTDRKRGKRRFYEHLESTGERQAATRVSTAQLAFENSRLECLRGRTV